MGLNLPRIVAYVIARRVAAVVVALILAAVASLLPASHAYAQVAGCTFNSPTTAICQTRGDAYAAASAMFDTSRESCLANQGRTWSYATVRNGTTKVYHRRMTYTTGGCGQGSGYTVTIGTAQWTDECPAGQTWDDNLNVCSECATGDETVTTPGNLGAYRCKAGSCPLAGSMCSGTQPGAPSGYVCWVGVGGSKCDANDEDFCPAGTIKSPLNGICYPEKECPVGTIKDSSGECIPPLNCPEGQSKDQFGNCKPNDSECPAGQLKSPEGNCLPGEGQCSAGEVRGSDGTCKKDSDGDGQADEGEDTGKFSGGESCDVPPQCSGDNIMCGQAVIQWRIDCNTRRQANISGGTCDAMPVCAGEKCDPQDYAQLIVSWRATCALEAMAQESGPGGSGDGDGPETWDAGGFGEAVAEAAAGATGPHCTGDDCPGGEGPGGTGELDSSGLGWGRACPALPTVAVMGATIDFNAVAGGDMCDWIALGGQIVLILAALASLRILAGGMA